ncbi:DNA-binding response regulator [Paenibacillus sp. 598K]|uniref:response regulator transcription factor n=1 Tax=Paenibacillus sp. 598K TaxID=1117987 RepID=UPI000FFB0040|nr:response regulator transcription factor [Paenibacillus sp. 598K]GBF77796.1 DNA-binding response regulator [Paenibacillus sp. 598K]
MHKVLIVDDELFVRKGLINLMDWASLQFEICGEAENGQQALEMIEQLEPDLVIVDIRMPVLDGLELIRQVKAEAEHQPLFVILSGYPDFSYAQQAFRYNVADYILKPVDEQELKATLKKLSGTLNQKRLLSITPEKPLVETVVESLLQTEPGEPVMEQIARTFELPRASSYAYVILEVQDQQPQGEEGYLSALRSALQQQLRQEDKPLLLHVRTYSQYGLIVPQLWLSEQGEADREDYARLRQALQRESGQPVALFVGRTVGELQQISSSGASAEESLNYRFSEQADGVFLADELLQMPLYYFDVDEELHSKLIYTIESNRQTDYTEATDAIFQAFRERHFAPGAVTNTVRRCMIAVINIIRQLEGDENDLRSLQELLNWQTKYRNLGQLREVFLQFIGEAAAYMAYKRGEKGENNIEKVKKYIDGHFRENIYLKGIAADFYMNPVYLGQLFRKQYGMYFNEYLLSLRIEEAKRLLRQTKKKMYEIAELVGFQNADYFATQFEKLENMTPTDYRNKMIGKN